MGLTLSLSSKGRSFSVIPEGRTTFKIMGIDDSKYSEKGSLGIRLQTAAGQTHVEWFNFIKNDGSENRGALNSWAYFVRMAMNDFNTDEIDTDDLIGHYITANVTHVTYTRKKDGQTTTTARLGNFESASGFSEEQKNERTAILDDFFGDV